VNLIDRIVVLEHGMYQAIAVFQKKIGARLAARQWLMLGLFIASRPGLRGA
jgi:hypothetical protein